jgi:hypothetical protein
MTPSAGGARTPRYGGATPGGAGDSTPSRGDATPSSSGGAWDPQLPNTPGPGLADTPGGWDGGGTTPQEWPDTGGAGTPADTPYGSDAYTPGAAATPGTPYDYSATPYVPWPSFSPCISAHMHRFPARVFTGVPFVGRQHTVRLPREVRRQTRTATPMR